MIRDTTPPEGAPTDLDLDAILDEINTDPDAPAWAPFYPEDET